MNSLHYITLLYTSIHFHFAVFVNVYTEDIIYFPSLNFSSQVFGHSQAFLNWVEKDLETGLILPQNLSCYSVPSVLASDCLYWPQTEVCIGLRLSLYWPQTESVLASDCLYWPQTVCIGLRLSLYWPQTVCIGLRLFVLASDSMYWPQTVCIGLRQYVLASD